MLYSLRIDNFVLVQSLEIELSPTLNVMTGETGAGKSIILKGLEALRGEKISQESIRAESDRSIIEGVFLIDEETLHALGDCAPEFAEIVDDGELILRRTIERAGRSKITANGRTLSKGEAASLASFLFDITGQHQSQSLLDSDRHIHLLDLFGVPSELKDEVERRFDEFSRARRRLEDFVRNSADREDRIRRIRYEAEELQDAQLQAGERENLEAELRRLTNLEFLLESAQVVETALDAEDGLLAKLRLISGTVDAALRKDPLWKDVAEHLKAASIYAAEGSRAISEYGRRLEPDPDRTEMLRERLSGLARIERKYGRTLEQLLEYSAQITQEIAEFDSGAFDREALERSCARLREELSESEVLLTEERKKISRKLAKTVTEELKLLAMPKARFEVRVSSCESRSTGADDVEFLFSANPGQPLLPLQKVASGGELSRLLLILKSLLHEGRASFLQVFDEIDTGVGGAVAQLVGEKLRSLASRCQVLIVTHSPQVAAFAERHFVIQKEVVGDQTSTSVRFLNEDEQVQELARMLAGKTVTPHFQKSAQELFQQGRIVEAAGPK